MSLSFSRSFSRSLLLLSILSSVRPSVLPSLLLSFICLLVYWLQNCLVLVVTDLTLLVSEHDSRVSLSVREGERGSEEARKRGSEGGRGWRSGTICRCGHRWTDLVKVFPCREGVVYNRC